MTFKNRPETIGAIFAYQPLVGYNENMKKKLVYLIIIFIILVIAFGLTLFFFYPRKSKNIASFTDCAQAGYPVLQSYPRQCRTPDGRNFTEAIVEKGILKGKVTVGPICPVERIGVPCPVPASAYTSREVIIYLADGQTIYARENFNADGTYYFELPPGNYVLGIPRTGVGGSKDLPQKISLGAGEVITFDFDIDTGIR